MAGALEGQGQADRVGEVLITGARYATLVSLPIVVTFILRGHSFIGLWMGEEYAEPAGDVLVLLATAFWASAGLQVCLSAMIGLNRHRGIIPAFGAEAVINIALSVVLLQSYGIYGVALGTLIPRLAIALFFGPWYARRVVGIPMARYWIDTLLRPSLSILPFALGSWAIEVQWPAPNLIVYFGQVLLASPLALLGAWFVFLTAEEREFYSTRLRRALNSSPGRS
jgi:O-antigen/teichoic acid export membrane protein